MKRVAISLVGAVASCGLTASADAVTVKQLISFTASDFIPTPNPFLTPAFSTLVGSVILSYTPTSSTSNDATDLQLLSLNFPVSSQVGFSTNGFGSFSIGGIADGVDGYGGNGNDFRVDFQEYSDHAIFVAAMYFAPIVSDDFLSFTGSVTVRDITGSVPEPASWALMVAGFGLIGVMSRRKVRTVAV